MNKFFQISFSRRFLVRMECLEWHLPSNLSRFRPSATAIAAPPATMCSAGADQWWAGVRRSWWRATFLRPALSPRRPVDVVELLATMRTCSKWNPHVNRVSIWMHTTPDASLQSRNAFPTFVGESPPSRDSWTTGFMSGQDCNRVEKLHWGSMRGLWVLNSILIQLISLGSLINHNF